MSVEAISVALHHSRAKGTDKLVLLGIANHDGDGGAWPSLETLAKYANCSISKVKLSIKELVDLGEISVKVHAGGDQNTRNDRRPNLYQVILRCPETCDGSKKHRTTATTSDCRTDTDDSQKSAPRQSKMSPTTVTTCSSEPSIEPSNRTKRSPQAYAGDGVAKTWWNQLNPKPLGKGAWFSLLQECREAVSKGWAPEQIYAALERIGRGVPSMAELDRELRRPRVDTFTEKKAREDRDQAEKAAAMRRALEEEDRQRRERIEREKAEAVPMTDEARERLEALGILTRKRSA